ncbi:MAG: MFS transporter [Geminicoccaceae bacterium]
MAQLAPPLEQDVRIVGVVSAAHGGSHFFQLVLPPLFPLLKASFGVGYAELGLLMGVLYGISGLTQTLAGVLVDRVGAARVLTGGLLLLGAGTLLASLAPAYPVLVLAAVLMGLGNAVFHPSDYAILAHHVAHRRMARAFSAHTVGGTLGWALAPVLVAGIAAASSWRTALLVCSLMGFALALMVLFHRDLLETPANAGGGRQGAGSQLRLLASGTILLCFAFFALQAASFVTVQAFLPLALHQLHDLPMVVATGTVTAFMLGSAGGTVAGGMLADRTGRHQRIIGAGLALAALIFFLLGRIALPEPLLLLAVALAGALAGLTTPSRDMLVRAAAPAGAAGKVFGFVYSGLDLGSTLTPVLMGTLLDAGRPEAVFVIIPLAMAASILTATTIRGNPQRPVAAR